MAIAKNVTAKRKEREKQQRIDSILSAARQVFFSRGYLRATMDEIALQAEISKPVVYQYFKSKDQLFFSLMLPVLETLEQGLALLDADVEKNIINNGDDLIRRYFKAAMDCYNVSPQSFRILMLFQLGGLISELKPEVRSQLNAKGQKGFELARAIINAGIKRKWIKNVNVYEMADLLWAVSIGVIQLEDAKLDEGSRGAFKKATLHLAENVIVEALVLKG